MKKSKVLILGCQGMVGHVAVEHFRSLKKYETFGLARNAGKNVSKVLDARNLNDLEEYLRSENFDFVINCIGVLIQEAVNDKSNAILVNSYLPNFLSECGTRYGYKLFHISTDCVFSGREGNYSESSECDGDSVYARTKILGEVSNNKDVTIRTSVIGPELKKNGVGLLHWFLNQKDEISGYSKVFWTGVTTLELAKALEVFLEEDVTGIIHLVPDRKISKYDLLKIAKDVFQREITINKTDNYFSDKSLLSTRNDISFKVSSYEDMMNELKVWMDNFGYTYI